MSVYLTLVTLLAMLFPFLPSTTPAASPGMLVPPDETAADICQYPVTQERFAITVPGDERIESYDVAVLGASGYLDWWYQDDAPHPDAMHYFPMVLTRQGLDGLSKSQIEQVARQIPGATWLLGNESENIWQDPNTPEDYARHYHEIRAFIRSVDPTARFAITGITMVTPLRLEWLNRVWQAYRDMYGVDMPVDVWNVHTFNLNEMSNDWGAELPEGIPYAVGYKGTWSLEQVSGASGGNVHRSNKEDAAAYFGFQGDQATVYLGKGPDAGVARVYLDNQSDPAAVVDLYSKSRGTVARTFTGLTPPVEGKGNRHHVRVVVSGDANRESSDKWVRVDAIQAPSTGSLPGGRLENDSRFRARLLEVQDHDRISLIKDQIVAFRQWMADHGQRNKPLINTEFGILMPEGLGFPYTRVRDFMLDSFDAFLYELIDPNLGYPADGNRLVQQWFWFSLALDGFGGGRNHSGLFDPITKEIRPLGEDFANYLAPLARDYADLQVGPLDITAYTPIFATQPGKLVMEAQVSNAGNIPSTAFQVRLSDSVGTVRQWSLPGLDRRYSGANATTLAHTWQRDWSDPKYQVTLALTDPGSNDACAGNNSRSVALTNVPAITDLTLVNVGSRVSQAGGGGPALIRLSADVTNLGRIGTTAGQITVNFWQGTPNAGGILLHSRQLVPQTTSLPATVSFDWQTSAFGFHDITIEVLPVPDEAQLQNNRQVLRVLVPSTQVFLPHAPAGATQANSASVLGPPSALQVVPYPMPSPDTQ